MNSFYDDGDVDGWVNGQFMCVIIVEHQTKQNQQKKKY